MKEFARKFYMSKAWQQCRRAYIAERMAVDGGVCQVCGREQGYIVHHIVALTEKNIKDPRVALNHNNLRYECKACHDEEEGHYLDGKGVRRLVCVFDENGQPKTDLRKI